MSAFWVLFSNSYSVLPHTGTLFWYLLKIISNKAKVISLPESSISLLRSWAPRSSVQVFHTAGVQDSPPSMLASCCPWRPLQANLCYWSFVSLFCCCPHCWPPAKPPEVKRRLWHCPPGDFLCCQPLAMTPELATQSAPRALLSLLLVTGETPEVFCHSCLPFEKP